MAGLEVLLALRSLFLALVLALIPPVALEIARACPSVPAAAGGATSTANRHTLTPAVTATATRWGSLSWHVISADRLRHRLVLFAGGFVRGGIRTGELEPGCCALLLSELSSLLCVCECKRVSSLVAATAASTTAGWGVLPAAL